MKYKILAKLSGYSLSRAGSPASVCYEKAWRNDDAHRIAYREICNTINTSEIIRTAELAAPLPFVHSLALPCIVKKKGRKKYVVRKKAIGGVAHNSTAHKSANERCKLRLHRSQKNASKVHGDRFTIPLMKLHFLFLRNIVS